jgi:hypothetical protein
VPEATAIRVPHYSPAENGAWCLTRSCKSYSCNRVSPTDSFSLVVIELAISTRFQTTSQARRDDEHELSKPESALSRVESACIERAPCVWVKWDNTNRPASYAVSLGTSGVV